MGNCIVTPATAADDRHLAEDRLPRFLFEYIDGGANDQDTMAANITDFRRYKLKQHVICDVGDTDTSTTRSGQAVSMPVALMGVNRMEEITPDHLESCLEGAR